MAAFYLLIYYMQITIFGEFIWYMHQFIDIQVYVIYTLISSVLTSTPYSYTSVTNCAALRNLVPFAQNKKREKHPWSSVKPEARG